MKHARSNGDGRPPGDRHKLEMSRSAVRSAVANGSRLLDGIDARSAPARRYRDLCHAFASDLGGSDAISAKRQLVRSAAGLVVIREYWDGKSLNGEPAEFYSIVSK